MAVFIARWFDIRPGEGKLSLATAGVLFFTIAGHTLLETVRDALFLTELDPSRLTLVYGALALLAIVAARASTLLSKYQGERRALALTLLAGIIGAGVFSLAPKTRPVVFALYLWTGLIASVAVAQFWVLAARVFTVAQAKRLLGPIASAGILGGVGGGGLAVLALRELSISELLPMAAMFFTFALVPLYWLVPEAARTTPLHAPAEAQVPSPKEEEPLNRRYLRLVAALIATATMTLLCIDYVFKASAARQLESAELGSFFAGYYALLNLVAFLFQLVLATQLLRRLGVLAAVAILPALLVIGSVMTFVVGPALVVVLLVKGADGSLRHSLHRTSTELLWMPLPGTYRSATKPVVDTFVVRFSQAVAAAGVFVLAWWQLDTMRVLAAVIAMLALLWIALTLCLRRPYLALFRRALQDDRSLEGPLRFTMESLEVLVEALSSMNPSRAIAAISLLASHGRQRLIPALTLFHPSPDVLLSALRHVPSAGRNDWIAPAERLIDHESEPVRLAAMGALLEHGVHDPIKRRLDADDPALRGHAAVLLAEKSNVPFQHASVRALLEKSGTEANSSKLALLRAIRGRQGWTELILQLLEDPDPEVAQQAVRSAESVKDVRLVQPLLHCLTVRRQRDAARDALLMQGPSALEETARLLKDPKTPPRLRRHLPRTISRFASQRAADILLELLASEPEGLVRYKALRGLGRLATETRVHLDAELLERLLLNNLEESLRMQSMHFTVSSQLRSAGVELNLDAKLLLDLLSDKAQQALERAFRLLQLLHADEDIRSVADAILSGERNAHAQALEYLSTLTLTLDTRTRELLRLAIDNLEPAVLSAQARAEVEAIPKDYSEAIETLRTDRDEALRAITEHFLQGHALQPEAEQPASDRGPATPPASAASTKIVEEGA